MERIGYDYFYERKNQPDDWPVPFVLSPRNFVGLLLLSQRVSESQNITAEPINDSYSVEGDTLSFQLFYLPDYEFIIFKRLLARG